MSPPEYKIEKPVKHECRFFNNAGTTVNSQGNRKNIHRSPPGAVYIHFDLILLGKCIKHRFIPVNFDKKEI